ncbi:hypothetical protein QA597_06935 [Marinilabiliaceae bacterium ANBcel2]|nr:hypothetical protein [Marinilabiliaceae bacterium ANBcel2]
MKKENDSELLKLDRKGEVLREMILQLSDNELKLFTPPLSQSVIDEIKAYNESQRFYLYLQKN